MPRLPTCGAGWTGGPSPAICSGLFRCHGARAREALCCGAGHSPCFHVPALLPPCACSIRTWPNVPGPTLSLMPGMHTERYEGRRPAPPRPGRPLRWSITGQGSAGGWEKGPGLVSGRTVRAAAECWVGVRAGLASLEEEVGVSGDPRALGGTENGAKGEEEAFLGGWGAVRQAWRRWCGRCSEGPEGSRRGVGRLWPNTFYFQGWVSVSSDWAARV